MKNLRQEKIISYINEHDFATVKELADLLQVSDMTIRRDLNELDALSKIKKFHGGGQCLTKIRTTTEKAFSNTSEKKYIGSIMNSLLSPDDVIFIGAGTTFMYAVENLTNKNSFIITNSLITFNTLIELKFEKIFLTGGNYFSKTSEFYGEHAESFLKDFNISKAFLATNGINKLDVTTSTPELARIQNVILNKAKENYIVADYSKFDTSDAFTFATLDDFDYLITDDKVPDNTLKEYSKYISIINQEV